MAKQNLIVVTNGFHDTMAWTKPGTADNLRRFASELTPAQRRAVARLRARLCGSPSCACGVIR